MWLRVLTPLLEIVIRSGSESQGGRGVGYSFFSQTDTP